MRAFLALVHRFKADQRGAFAVIFGVIAIVLVATAGAVVDFTTIEQARAKAQDALDSAALGLQPKIFITGETEATLKEDAEALLLERLSGEPLSSAEVDDVDINVTDGTLRLEASIEVPMSFVSLVGVSTIRATVVSEATRKRLAVEVAFVLDNSGSMSQQNRMTNLKAATRCAMNVLLNKITECSAATITATTPVAPTETNIKLGIVPFTHFVNVGTGYANAVWMDTEGMSPISNDNFDDDDDESTEFTGDVNRFDLFTQIGTTWSGCVEARPYPYDTDDTPANEDEPATLYVPLFAPDEPGNANSTGGGYSNSYLNDSPNTCAQAPSFKWTQTKYSCDQDIDGASGATQKRNRYNNAICTGGAAESNVYETIDENGVVTSTTTAPDPLPPASLFGNNPSNPSNAYDRIGGSGPSGWTSQRIRTWTYPFSDRELQERICKYDSQALNAGSNTLGGPKQACPASSNAITPLTATKSTIAAAITAMSANGFTNIHEGTAWGYRLLTPAEPFPEASSFDSGAYKVMIVMTDGEHTVNGYDNDEMNFARGYAPFGYPGPPVESGTAYNGRIFSEDYPAPASDVEVTAAMDSRLVETCANAKARGIRVYTIGLATSETSNPTKVRTMLETCASSLADAKFPANSDELVTTFQQIASELAELRLAQ